jgi:hypothetical protein
VENYLLRQGQLNKSVSLPPAFNFPMPLRQLDIDPYQTGQVYDESFDGYIGFMTDLGIALKTVNNEKAWVYIDSVLLNNQPFTTPIGSLLQPAQFDPPVLVKHKITVDMYNGSSSTLTFRVYLGGIMFKDERRKKVVAVPPPTPSPPEKVEQVIQAVAEATKAGKIDISTVLLPPEAYAQMDSYTDLPPSPYSLRRRRGEEEDFIF